MGTVSWIILSVVAVAAIAAVISVARSRGKCSSCTGNCEFCKYKDNRKK